MIRNRCVRSFFVTGILVSIVVFTQLFLVEDTTPGSDSERILRENVVIVNDAGDEREWNRLKAIESFSMTCTNCTFANTSSPNRTNVNNTHHESFHSFLRGYVQRLNHAQIVHNLDRFDLQSDGEGSLVIIVQVHNRSEYLHHLISSLRSARHIEQVLLIFSHDVYSSDLNKIVASIDFCPVMQIFFPYSLQQYPDEFPGEDPRDCPRNVNKEQAAKLKCLNANTPDKYGHYREAKYSQIKHHWFWKANHVFDYLEVTRYYNGLVLLLEDDHYVVKDFVPVLRQMHRLKTRVCSHCSIFTLGTYDKTPTYGGLASKVDVLSWISAKHNMGMAFDRTTWNQIKACATAFCQFDDYNWDWSLQFLGAKCLPNKLKAIIVKSPRVHHIGECGGIHSKKGKTCEAVEAKVRKINQLVTKEAANLFPHMISVANMPYSPDRVPRPNGGWGDVRDHSLCLNFTQRSTHV